VIRRVGQDSKRSRSLARGVTLLALLAGCEAPPPSAAVATPYGEVRADSTDDAQELAESLVHLRPLVLALLPDAVARTTEVWLDPSLHEGPGGTPGVAALTSLGQGRIRIGTGAAGIGREFLLAHELVHAHMGPSWDPLPAIMKEGLCDALACRLVPRDAPRARALRWFSARFAFGRQELLLTCEQPGFGGRTSARLAVSSPAGPPRGPLEALELPGRGVGLHDGRADEDVLYGYGLLLVERALARIGLPGLNALCVRAQHEGRSTLPIEWALWAAELDHDPSSWQRALAEGLGAPELDALTSHLAEGLAEAVVSSTRWKFPDLDAERFLDEARPSLGLRGGDLQVALSELPGLRDAVLADWPRHAPEPLRPGGTAVHVDGDGVHMGLVLSPQPESPDVLLQWMRIESAPADEAGGAAAAQPAALEALVRLGVDADGPYLSSTLPAGFDEFRVEVLGVPVSDLRFDLNVDVRQEDDGTTTVRCRLDPSLQVRDAVFYPAQPNVLLLQRAAGSVDEQRVPLLAPLAR
jgi:hypothetical protein